MRTGIYCSLLLLAFVKTSSAQTIFCVQFFKNIWTKAPISVTAYDNTPAGGTLKQFSSTGSNKTRVQFTAGDIDKIAFDPNTLKLRSQRGLRDVRGKRLILSGRCDDYVEILALPISLDVEIHVEVLDGNDPPVFRNLPASVELPEDSIQGALVYHINVDDPFDVIEENRIIHFAIVGVEADGQFENRTMFSITDDGDVELEGELDYDFGAREYKINIQIEDEGYPIQFNDSVLTVRITDADDLGPKFLETDYYAQIIGEKPVEWVRIIDNVTVVGKEECFETTPRIYAVDQDPDRKSKISYRILDGTPGTETYWGAFFRLETDTGKLCQKQAVPRSIGDDLKPKFHNFTFRIQAYQGEAPDMTDEATLHIDVLDINQHVPTFEKTLYLVEINEFPNTKWGDVLTKVEASDEDYGINAVFEFELLSNPGDALSVDKRTGEVAIVKPEYFDRETIKQVEVQVRAREVESAEKFVSDPDATVRIVVLDVNDNTPSFKQDEYVYTIKDKHEVGAPVQTDGVGINATDPDAGHNGEVEYRIDAITMYPGPTGEDEITRFNVDDKGLIRLSTGLRELRRQKIFPTYEVIVTAYDKPHEENMDGRRSSSATVTVKVEETNDFSPEFGDQFPQTIYVLEGSPIGTLISKATATDKDGDEDIFLEYKFSSGNDDESFDISNVGWVTTKIKLDREKAEEYDLVIQVTDGKFTTETTVYVIVNDTNDNPPRFKQERYIYGLYEEPEVGAELGKVEAYDLDSGDNGEISYRIIPGFGSELFSIDQEGQITVKATSEILDREKNERLQLVVEATDHGEIPRQSQVTVEVTILDVNDNSPKFTKRLYEGSVVEDDKNPQGIQEVILKTPISAVDPDQVDINSVRYKLEGEDADLFVIDPITGKITVKTPGTIDAETNSVFNLKIIATDSTGMTSSSDLKINVTDTNDNPPSFPDRKFTFDIDKDITVGSVIGRIVANDNDSDNSKLLYILKGGGGNFEIDPETGEIRVINPLDKDGKTKYVLTIKAIDNGDPRQISEVDVTINVPYNRPPAFDEAYTFNVPENAPIGTIIGQVSASDIDLQPSNVIPNLPSGMLLEAPPSTNELSMGLGEPLSSSEGLTYAIVEPDVPFKIDPATGEVTTQIRFDSETTGSYEFTVKVTDSGDPPPPKTATTKVTVIIEDANDNMPEFTLDKYEGTVVEDNDDPKDKQPVRLFQVISATDKDLKEENRDIRYTLTGDDSRLFQIEPISARVFVSDAGRGNIDREKQDMFKMKVVATDQGGAGLSAEADLHIYVLDENDNSPSFAFAHESRPIFTVDENVTAGTMIGSVLASDSDATDPNNQILYLLESDPHGKFKVDVSTGGIYALEGVHYPPSKENYRLKVAAIDKGSPTRRAETEVEVKLSPRMPIASVSANQPRFVGPKIFKTPEEQTIGSIIGKVIAVDADAPDDGPRLEVYIKEKDKNVPFSLDPLTGDLKVKDRLDRDYGQSYYEFDVITTGNTLPPVDATTRIAVIVQDINDNPPHFSHAEYRHVVYVGTPPWSVVSTPWAFDDIDEIESVYEYSLKGLPLGAFHIDNRRGTVFASDTIAALPQGTETEYTIEAMDIYNNELKATAKLKVTVMQPSSGDSDGKCCCILPCQRKKSRRTNYKARPRNYYYHYRYKK